jgi:uncharacterized NAD(P)/FAD-binding protein YdhS
VLERFVTAACRRTGVQAVDRIDVVEPGSPGSGVYGASQPDYLILNTPSGQMSIYPSPDEEHPPPYGVSLHEWATRMGYRWQGDSCRIASGGRPLSEHDYLPRRIMGQYLAWLYRTLLACAPASLEIVEHRTRATDIVRSVEGGELVHLEDGGVLPVSHVFLTTGHTENLPVDGGPSEPHLRSPYPIEQYADLGGRFADVGIAGMGLVAMDLVAALTIGRGGRFVDHGSRKSYRRSGHEPRILLFSRSGVPYCAKPVNGRDPTAEYTPAIFTAEETRRLGGPSVGRLSRGSIDFRRAVLPLILAEMQVAYYSVSARMAGGPKAGVVTYEELRDAWVHREFSSAIGSYARRYGAFDPESALFAGGEADLVSAKSYEADVYRLIETDLDEALRPGGSSPLKAAYEILRVLRDPMRSVVEFGNLTLQSHLDFQLNIRGHVNRLVAGPPALRSQQLLALLDAGVLVMTVGPHATVSAEDGRLEVRSTQLEQPHVERPEIVVRAHLDDPLLDSSASTLIANLFERGRLIPLSYGGTAVGSVELTRDFHPVNRSGETEHRLFILGALTEGTRYFTHYLPSPHSRIRAILDAQACVDQVMG